MMRILILILLLFETSLIVVAQISVDHNDMPEPGDTIRLSTGLNLDFIDYTETGEDYYWDFSELISISQRVDTFVTVLETPLFYWPFFLTSANLASPIIQDSVLPGLPLTNVYQFYNNNSNNYKDVGFAATVSGMPLPINYNQPDILYNFPLDFGNVDSSFSGLELGLPDIAYVLIDRKRKNTVDGWGTLATPYGVFEVLRVRSEVTEYDSIYIDSLQIGIPVNREYTEYKWLGKDFGLPLLTITDNLFGLFVEYIDSLEVVPVGIINQNTKEDCISVYPNPTQGKLTVEIELDQPGLIDIQLHELKGKLIIKQNIEGKQGKNQIVIDLIAINCTPGTYILSLSANYRTNTRKIVFSN